MNTLAQELRHAFRTLVRGGSLTAVAVLTLAVALGANTAIFTLVNAILLDPLPFGDPARIVTIRNLNASTGKSVGQHSYPNIVDIGKNVKSIETIAAYSTTVMTSRGSEAGRFSGPRRNSTMSTMTPNNARRFASIMPSGLYTSPGATRP